MRETQHSFGPGHAVGRHLFLLALLLATASSVAAPLTENQIRSAVETWVRQVTAQPRVDSTIQSLEAQVVDGRTVAYVAHLNGDGFCLCGADDLLLPVYFYSPHGIFDANNPGMQMILAEMEGRLAAYQRDVQTKTLLPEGQETFAARAAYWRELMAGRPPAPRQTKSLSAPGIPTQIILPLTSKWGQGSPYNDQCPAVPSTTPEPTLVGCVAMAAAQIMNYWKWPAAGQGVSNVVYAYQYRTSWDSYPLPYAYLPAGLNGFDPNRLRWSSSSGGVLQMTGYWDGSLRESAKEISGTNPTYSNAVEVLFSRLTSATAVSARDLSTPIRWDLIGVRHTDPPDAGDNAVAELCATVGAAVWMGYGLANSATSISHVPTALRNNFFYDSSVVGVPPANKSINEMTEEIQWLRPIQMDGSKPNRGGIHDFVIYGYNMSTDPNRQFLVNFGWDGSSDGWYSTDTMIYTVSQNYVKNIAPKDVVKFVGGILPGSGSPASPYLNLVEALAFAPDHATLIFKAGSLNTFAANSITINRPLTLKGANATIQRQ